MSVRRKVSRGVTAFVAGVVMLGTLTGTASADGGTTIPDVHVQHIPPTEDAVELAALAVDLAGICLASEGLCASAVATASDALLVATRCAEAMANELADSPGVVLALQRVALDCAEVVRLMRSLAEFAVGVANDCANESTPTCQTAFDAARSGMALAWGCVSAILPVQLAGSDPGCASALAMLYREAEGILAMLTGCLNGSDMFCQQVREHAEFARDGLAGCAGQVLWVLPSAVQAVPAGGPLPCYAVLDQVVVSINALLGQVPDLPTQMTPTNEPEECSITVAAALPTVQLSDPTLAVEHYQADTFVPSCDEPESLHTVTNVQTPGLAGNLIGPYCEPNVQYVIDRVKRDGVAIKWDRIVENRNARTATVTVEDVVKSSIGAKITVGAETELKVWVQKVKASITAEASVSREWTHSISVTVDVGAGRQLHVASMGYTKVIEGRRITTYDNCDTRADFRRVRVPYKDAYVLWEEPLS